jgi:2-aminoadipate transaminase
MLEQGTQQAHLQLLRSTYCARARALAANLEKYLGGAAKTVLPAGGFFFWVRLEDVADTEKLLPRAYAGGVTFAPGSRFSTSGGQREYLRLSFSYYDEEHIEEGVARLAAAVLKG